MMITDTAQRIPAVQLEGHGSESPLLRPGDIFAARYHIVAAIGSGAFATVFDAWDTVSRRALALKVYHHCDARSRKMAFREAALLAEISHPNLVRSYAAGESEQGNPFSAMERAAGASLAQINRDQQLSVDEVLALFAVLAATLQAVHAEGVLHGDVKEGNVIIPVEGGQLRINELRLVDFGLAKYMSHCSRNNTLQIPPGRIAGTPRYMAPEQLQGRAHGVPAEIFALGALVYGCIYRDRPLCEERIAKWEVSNPGGRPFRIPIVRNRLMSPIEIPDAPDIPDRLHSVLQCALAFLPEERFQTMREINNALLGPI